MPEGLCQDYTVPMGELPADGVTPSPPFSNVGIDYAGPILYKLGHVRKPVHVKAYVAVFVCICVKAAHLELVEDLTTEAFLTCVFSDLLHVGDFRM